MASPRRLRQLCFGISLVATLVIPVVAAAQTPSPPEASERLELPGPAAGLAAAVGIDAGTPRARLLLEVVRTIYAAPLGQCRDCDRTRDRLVAWLAAPRPSSAALAEPVAETSGRDGAVAPTAASPPGDDSAARLLPSPIPLDAWRRLLKVERADTLAATLLQDRRAALVYYGLMGLDAPSRAYLAGHPDLLQAIYKDHAAAFAVFGRSVRIAGAAVVVPGGPENQGLVEAIVGERITDPAAFMRAVLGRANGRFAFFYDTVVHADAARRSAMLASQERDPAARVSRVHAIVKFFTDLQPEWRVADRPFARPLLDASLVILTVSFTPDGRLVGPENRRIWEAAFRGGLPADDDAEQWQKALQPVAAADAAWLLGQTLTVDVPTGRQRLGAICFVQRLFADVPPAQWPAVARVARAFIDARAAMVALERLGVTDVSVFDRLAARSSALSRAGERGAASLAQFQALVGVVDRLQARRVIAHQQALALIDALIALPLSDDGQYGGRVSRWMRAHLLEALPALVGGDNPEVRLVSALAGRTAVPSVPSARASAAGTVTWEGVSYQVDVAGAEYARLQRVRARQLGNELDGVMGLAGAVAALADAPAVAGARRACAEIDYFAAKLQPVSWPAPGIGAPLAKPAELVAAPCKAIREIHSDGELKSGAARQTVDELWAVSDAVLADALTALSYALHVGDPAGAVELAPDIARRHRFGFSEGDGARLAAGPWTLPEEHGGTGTPWHVTGSLLGLEHALAKLSLRFLFGQEMPSAPRINESDRRTLALGLSLLNPAALDDATRDRLVGAIAAGRARLASNDALARDLDHVAEVAGWSEWRCETIRWALASDPDSVAAMLTLSDYFWVGLADGAAGDLSAWGAATTPVDGDLRLAWPPARPWEDLAGRSASGQLMTRFIDMNLRVAEALAQYHLPAQLAAGTLAPALADLIHEAPLGHADDWYALAGYVARLPEERMLDYIAALAAGGPLVPVDEARSSPGQ